MRTYNCRVEDFYKFYKKKRIICFGASQAAKIFCQSLQKWHIEDYIDYFVDNDSSKWETTIFINSKDFLIKSPTTLKKENMEGCIIFITSRFWHEIHQQLANFTELENAECYSFILFKTHNSISSMPLKTNCKEKPKIPKTIHYCWFGKGQMPSIAIQCIQSWKKFCPDYEIIEWNESNYDVHKNRFTKEVYDYGHYSALSSYARFDIIQKYGGIYLDTDVEVVKSLDELLFNEAFMGFEVSNYVNSGHGFGAKKGNELYAENIDIYDNISFLDKNGMFHYKQAPVITTEMLIQHGLKLNGEMQVIGDTLIYPNDYFDPAMQEPVENTYSIHRYSSLWSLEGKDIQSIWEQQRLYYKDLIRKNEIEER